jgi:P4 family phage/plasmid primase-like protien
MPAACAPDAEQIERYLEVAFGHCEGLIPVRGIAEKGRSGQLRPRNVWLPVDDQAATQIHDFARSAAQSGLAVFVVPGTVAKAGQAGASDVQQMQTILVDIDHGDIGAKRDHLARHLGEPTLEVASGGVTPEGQRKLHLYWRLSEAAEGDDTTLLCRSRHMLALKVGGDPAFGSAHQPIRVAGTIHNKTGTPRLVEILQQRERDFHLADLVEAIETMPPLDGLVMPERTPGDCSKIGKATDLFGKKIREGAVDETTRFEALTRIIGYWVRRCRDGHVTAEHVWNEIADFNLAQIDPPWPEDRLRREASKIWELDRIRHGGAGASTGDSPGNGTGDSTHSVVATALSEDALAEQFSQTHGNDWRYVAAWGQWRMWTGSVWRRENTLLAYDLARSVCRAAAADADPKVRAKISSASTIAAVERIARADRRHAEGTDVWDWDPWVLNTPNGLVDLRSGKAGPHDRALAMTKITSASPQGSCTVWSEFLATVTGGDVELQSYLQRMAGYCLTGVTTEHALFFLYGTGANGKSVFANTLTTILGDYAAVAAMDMFMTSHGDRHPTDMAGLRGARVVTAIETEQGSRWAESKLKALTGGDKISARFMRQDFFEFTPQFKLLIVGNHKPSIRNVDEAMRRRLHMVPFTITIAPGKRDKTLPERLLAERDGILAWALEGCLEWQRIGLQPPAAVMAATDEYFEAEDAIGRWIDERCDLGNQLTAASIALFADWKLWAENNGEYAGSNKRFAETLTARGIERWRSSQAKGFRGIALRTQPSSTTMQI